MHIDSQAFPIGNPRQSIQHRMSTAAFRGTMRLATICLLWLSVSIAAGQESKPPVTVAKAPSDTEVVVTPQQKELFDALEKMLNNVRLIGHFTVDGKPMKDLNEETYEIRSFKKLPEDKMWMIAARIKYGKYDVTVPMALAIEWADKTPVITLDKVAIPGLGTFSARVLFHDQKYAGTWTHDNVGGHLFGRIEKGETVEKQ